MPRARRTRTISAAPDRVWEVIADPYHLPRWWPNTQRVENVSGPAGRGRTWTQVLATRQGRGIRADYRCTAWSEGSAIAYEQILEGSPFEKFLRESTTEVKLEPAGGSTDVTLATEQRMRGLSRFGGPMMRRAAKRTLRDALDGLAEAVGGEPAAREA